MRAFLTVVHRWLGLGTAIFLIIAGLTGAVTSWDHELDEWLNSDLMHVDSKGPMHHPFEIAAAVEASDPKVKASYIPLGLEEGHTSAVLITPRIDPETKLPYKVDYTHVFVDPVTLRIVGHRNSKAISLSKRSLMPFLRDVHTSLHAPAFWGTDRWGYWLMGMVALIWLVDSFVAMYLTMPRKLKTAAEQVKQHRTAGTWLSRWKPSWLIRWRAGGYKLNFDLHRAGGLWVWGIILVVAFTSFSLNLYREMFYPVLSLVSQTTPGPYQTRTPTPLGITIAPKLQFADALGIAKEEAVKRKFVYPPGGIYYAARYGFYNVSFFPAGADDVNGSMGLSNLYIDALDGAVLGETVPWKGSAADVFAQLQFPLHSGRILGMTGRIMMSLMGIVVAMLAVTGIVIWARKRKARALRDASIAIV